MKYEILKVNGCSYVLSNFKRISNENPQPNFLGLGKALAGILRKGQTLEQWIVARNKYKITAEQNSYSVYDFYIDSLKRENKEKNKTRKI